MITPETVVAMSIRFSTVMDQLGVALGSDLVIPNPHLRRLAQFGESFLLQRGQLPGQGDWELYIEGLDAGMIREGTREALGRVLGISTDGFDPNFFAERVVEDLQKAAAQVARARLNELQDVDPAALATLAERVAEIRTDKLTGLARLSDIDVWAKPPREDDRMPTGYPTLDKWIGGWGDEMVMMFADSKAGKSLWLQNAAKNAAGRGKNVLHITLELGLRQQIQRYYRQIAQYTREDIAADTPEFKNRLRQWFKFAKGGVYLLEFAPYSLDVAGLKRVILRVQRAIGAKVDVLVLDYLDLMSVEVGAKSNASSKEYSDLGKLTHGVRGLCSPHELKILTASQSVRKPKDKNRLQKEDMGDSYNKVRGVDVLLSLMQTEDEAETYQGRMGLVAVRDFGGMGVEVPLYINRDMAYIQELETPNTRQLMKRLGHLPSQLAQSGQQGLMGMAARA